MQAALQILESKLALNGLQKLIADFCARWKVIELAFFGSVLRDDFGPESDVDVLITFATGVRRGFVDLGRMEDELAAMLARPVDILTRRGVEMSHNPNRKQRILQSAEVVYAAA